MFNVRDIFEIAVFLSYVGESFKLYKLSLKCEPSFKHPRSYMSYLSQLIEMKIAKQPLQLAYIVETSKIGATD